MKTANAGTTTATDPDAVNIHIADDNERPPAGEMGAASADPSLQSGDAAAVIPTATFKNAGEALKTALAAFEKILSDIAENRALQAKIQKEVDDYLATVDPRDTEALSVVSAKRTQLEILPNWLRRSEEKAQELGRTLILCIEAFPPLIDAQAEAEIEPRLAAVARSIRPWFPDTAAENGSVIDNARQLAWRSPFVIEVTMQAERSRVSHWSRPSGRDIYGDRTDQYDRSLTRRAGELIAIYEDWKQAGECFPASSIPSAPSAALAA